MKDRYWALFFIGMIVLLFASYYVLEVKGHIEYEEQHITDFSERYTHNHTVTSDHIIFHIYEEELKQTALLEKLVP